MFDLKPNAQRAKTAIILIWIVLSINALNIITEYFSNNLLVKVQTGQYISKEETTLYQIQAVVIGGLMIITTIVSAITFIMWFRRAYYNLHRRVKHLNFDEGWAAGAWFVPIINLGRPVRIMSELYKETHKLYKKKLPGYEGDFTFTYIALWWTLWIISSVLGQISFRMTNAANSVSDLKEAGVVSIIDSLLGIVLALVTIKVIKDYAAMEEKLPEVPFDDSMPQQDYSALNYPR